jgi:hypothetical protein
MIFVLIFLLSWLSDLFVIYLFAFFSYESFSIIDITSFAVFTLAGSLIVMPIFYLFVLRWLNKRIIGSKQFIYFPVALLLLANMPAYIAIWYGTNDFFGRSEALLFYLGFCTNALVFGLAWAWKNRALKVKKVE